MRDLLGRALRQPGGLGMSLLALRPRLAAGLRFRSLSRVLRRGARCGQAYGCRAKSLVKADGPGPSDRFGPGPKYGRSASARECLRPFRLGALARRAAEGEDLLGEAAGARRLARQLGGPGRAGEAHRVDLPRPVVGTRGRLLARVLRILRQETVQGLRRPFLLGIGRVVRQANAWRAVS